MHRVWLISYDVGCPRRRYRLDKLLGRWGDRVLESLWEARLSAEQAQLLAQKLRHLLHPEHDALALIPQCADCQRANRRMGDPQQPGPGGARYFVV